MANSKKPNFLIMWGDDIGQSNLSIIHTLSASGRPQFHLLYQE